MEILQSQDELKREISAFQLGTNIFNYIVGAGIFVLPATVAGILGPSSLAAYLFCALLITLIMLCFAEVGSKITSTGGVFVYTEAAFGPVAGFIISSLLWFGIGVISDGAVVNALYDIIERLIPALSPTYFRIGFIILIFGFLAWINVASLKYSLRLIKITTVGKLLPMLGVVFLGVAFIHPAFLKWSGFPHFDTLENASLVLFFAFIGGENALSNSGEVTQANRNIPKGILIGIGAVIILYLCIQVVCQGVMGSALAGSSSPLGDTAEKIVGPAGLLIISIGVAISIFGSLSGDVLATPRILFANARDGLLPGFLAKIDHKRSTPKIAVLVYSALGCIFAISGGFKQLAILGSAAALLIYLFTVLATIKLRYTMPHKSGMFRIKGGLLVPILAVAAIIWLLSGLKLIEIEMVVLFIVIVLVIYFIGHFFRRKNADA
ncbi:MAG TPA: APC family permease [Balneolales bacterium]|nr:APC family permease [Balneolales bacterium]